MKSEHGFVIFEHVTSELIDDVRSSLRDFVNYVSSVKLDKTEASEYINEAVSERVELLKRSIGAGKFSYVRTEDPNIVNSINARVSEIYEKEKSYAICMALKINEAKSSTQDPEYRFKDVLSK